MDPQPTKTKIFYHEFLSHEYIQPLIFPKLWYFMDTGVFIIK